MTFQERLRLAFDREQKRRLANGEQKLTKTMLWKAAKKTSGACTHWFNGENGMDLDSCIKTAPLLNVNPFWLHDESEPMDKKYPICSGDKQISTELNQPMPTEYLSDDERLILKGFREASDEARSIMLALARKVIDDKAEASHKKNAC